VTLQLLINGISLGSVYALVAVGFALIFNILKFSNFSHGGLMSVTAYIGYVASIFLVRYIHALPLFVATLLAAALGGGLLALVVERVAFRRLRESGSSVIYYFISSITMGILMENSITIFASSNFYSYPPFFPAWTIRLFGALTIAVPDLLTLCFSASALVILLVVLFRTKIGLAIRCTSFDTGTAKLMGMDPNRVVAAAFFASGVMGGVAGVFLGINYTLYPQLGQLIVKGFVASVIGGLGSISGALIGAVLLGVVEIILIDLVGAGWSPVFIFVIMLIFLLLRPRGISGLIVQEKA